MDEVRKRRDSERASKLSVAAAIVSAEADVAVAKAKASAAESRLKSAKAETLVAQREQEELEVMLEFAKIHAPFEGVVTQRNIDPGNLVRSGESNQSRKPLFVVSQLSKVRIQVPVPETAAPFVSRGDEVIFSFPSFSDETIKGGVTRKSESLDQQTRTMLVEVEVANEGNRLLPGMFGQATITLSSTANANVLPARAVRFDEAGKGSVYVVDETQTVSVIEVTTEETNGQQLIITSGLKPGQRVIDAHLKRFVDGEKVVELPN